MIKLVSTVVITSLLFSSAFSSLAIAQEAGNLNSQEITFVQINEIFGQVSFKEIKQMITHEQNSINFLKNSIALTEQSLSKKKEVKEGYAVKFFVNNIAYFLAFAGAEAVLLSGVVTSTALIDKEFRQVLKNNAINTPLSQLRSKLREELKYNQKYNSLKDFRKILKYSTIIAAIAGVVVVNSTLTEEIILNEKQISQLEKSLIIIKENLRAQQVFVNFLSAQVRIRE